MNQEKIGKFIAQCRKDKNLTQLELAEKLGVTDKSISNWENGKNMPDLSLFKPLCIELEISLNDLMSGEKVKEKEYQKKLEENIVNVIVNDKKKNSKKIRCLIIVIIMAFILYILSSILYNTVELNVKYDSRTMKCNFSNNDLIYEISGTSVLNTNYIEKNIDGKKYLVFHSTINLYNKKRSNFEYGYSFAKLNDGKNVPFGYKLILDHFKEDDLVYVYYSNSNINNIKEKSNSEFLKSLEKYRMMCNNG